MNPTRFRGLDSLPPAASGQKLTAPAGATQMSPLLFSFDSDLGTPGMKKRQRRSPEPTPLGTDAMSESVLPVAGEKATATATAASAASAVELASSAAAPSPAPRAAPTIVVPG